MLLAISRLAGRSSTSRSARRSCSTRARPEQTILRPAGAPARGAHGAGGEGRRRRPRRRRHPRSGDAGRTPTRTVLVKYRGATGAVLWGPCRAALRRVGLARRPEARGQRRSGLRRNGTDRRASIRGASSCPGSERRREPSSGGLRFSRRPMPSTLALDGKRKRRSLVGSSVILKCDGMTGSLLWRPFPVCASFPECPPGRPLAATSRWRDRFRGSPRSPSTTVRRERSPGAPCRWPPHPVRRPSAVDASGNILLAGSALVMKLRGADGSTAWGPVALVDPAGFMPSADSLSLDPSGNPVVGAFTFDGVTSTGGPAREVRQRVRNASLGARDVGRTIRGPRLQCLTVDSSGDVVVAANGLNDAYQDLVGAEVLGRQRISGVGPGDVRRARDELPRRASPSSGKTRSSPPPRWGRCARCGSGSACSLETQSWQLPPAVRGREYEFAFRTRNGDRLAFSVESGALPSRLRLDPSSGEISGVAGSAGAYSFRLRVESGAASVERDFTMVVVEGQPPASPAA